MPPIPPTRDYQTNLTTPAQPAPSPQTGDSAAPTRDCQTNLIPESNTLSPSAPTSEYQTNLIPESDTPPAAPTRNYQTNLIPNSDTPVFEIHPLHDPRWAPFVAAHPRSSVFHSVPWLQALHRTYGYQPVAFTTTPPGEPLRDGLVLCRVASWITGRRLVSLPFSDHCDPLIPDSDLPPFAAELTRRLHRDRLRYVELRPKRSPDPAPEACRPAQTFCFHELDLRPPLQTLFANCHKSSTQRKVQRAEREGLAYVTGRSPELLQAFSRLLLLTRRRHLVPPQPLRWFRNLVECFGEDLQIRVAFHARRPVAAILTLRHRDTLVYKYGGSDERFHSLGGTQLLFWQSIQEAKRDGLRAFDLGRSDWENDGLLTFKDRWGAARSTLTYLRFGASEPPARAHREWPAGLAKRIVAHLPDPVLRLVGSLVYRHFG